MKSNTYSWHQNCVNQGGIEIGHPHRNDLAKHPVKGGNIMFINRLRILLVTFSIAVAGCGVGWVSTEEGSLEPSIDSGTQEPTDSDTQQPADAGQTEEPADTGIQESADEGPPEPQCNNGDVEDGEVCDSQTINCVDLPGDFSGGQATCTSDCQGWDTSSCQQESQTIEDALAQVSKARMKEMLEKLASQEFNGRNPGSGGDRLTMEYMKEHFIQAGAQPGNPKTGTYKQEFPYRQITTQNPIGVFPGNDPTLKEQVILFGGHCDALGAPVLGANDNASGTVAVLEIAYGVGLLKNLLKRTIVLMGFQAEEKGLIGSRYYCREEPLYPLKNTILMFNYDMVGTYTRSIQKTEQQQEIVDFLDYLYSDQPISYIDPDCLRSPQRSTDSAPFRQAGVKVKDYCCARIQIITPPGICPATSTTTPWNES